MFNNLKNIPVTDIKGISTAREKLFNSVGIKTIYDLITYYPRSYQNRGATKPVVEAVDGETVSIIMEVITPVVSNRVKTASKRTQTVQHLTVSDETQCVKIVYFNREYLKDTFVVGKKFRFYGVITKNGRNIEMNSPEFEAVYTGFDLPPFVPVYPLTAGLTQKLVGSCVSYSLSKYKDYFTETLPGELVKKYGLMSNYESLRNIHFPENDDKLNEAKRRLAFEELFSFFIKTMRLGSGEVEGSAYRIKYPDMRPFVESLPYKLTSAQKYAIHDILKDMSGTDKPEKQRLQYSSEYKYIKPSRRLVQGDVGCGKTMVACAAIYAAVKSGYQAALMAPTSILANQHYLELTNTLGKFGIRCVLLTGGMKLSEKQRAIIDIAEGNADVIIGTHALIEDNVVFKRLALAITDEQHRFGVMQRRALGDKNYNNDATPHVVVMSATPIPRTLAMIMYCDLDVSIIDKMPVGRIPVETYAVDIQKRERVYKFISELVAQGKQGYIVCPLAEEKEDADINSNVELKSAKEYCKSLENSILGDYRIEYIHGKMKQADKDIIMERFADGRIDILVSTTVIEVGVNVPNACVMLIENCERFGLSQLHQLRGRVGRGSDKSYCILMSPIYQKATRDSDFRKRVDILCQSSSGFVVAEKDLEIRGPGEFFGLRQSGEFRFKIASLSADMSLVIDAKTEAENYYKSNYFFNDKGTFCI